MSNKTKIQKEYIDMGFGFPVYLLNVPMVNIRGTWIPKVNYKKLAEVVLLSLAQKPFPLTGNELKFIRTKLEMTLNKFANRFYVTHPAVLKWENKGDEATNMNWSTEKDIRLFAYTQITEECKLLDLYNQLQQKPKTKLKSTKINVAEDQGILTK